MSKGGKRKERHFYSPLPPNRRREGRTTNNFEDGERGKGGKNTLSLALPWDVKEEGKLPPSPLKRTKKGSSNPSILLSYRKEDPLSSPTCWGKKKGRQCCPKFLPEGKKK